MTSDEFFSINAEVQKKIHFLTMSVSAHLASQMAASLRPQDRLLPSSRLVGLTQETWSGRGGGIHGGNLGNDVLRYPTGPSPPGRIPTRRWGV